MNDIPNELMTEVRRILIKEWDPIGVSEFSDAEDEYDAYVVGVSKIVWAGQSVEQIYTHLQWIERDRMGLTGVDGDDIRTRNIAIKLVRLGLDTKNSSLN